MSATHHETPSLHGVMAEYADERALIAGIERAKADMRRWFDKIAA